jgi:putative lipoic acid-binding regulatory protein
VEENNSLLKFPCDFPIKAMGLSASGFEARALEIVRRHAPDFKNESMYSAASKQGKYISVTFTLTATSQAQLDAIYRELTSCEDIVMVL